MELLGLLSLRISTIAAPCAGRTVSSVVAIRAYLGGEDPERERSRELQRGFQICCEQLLARTWNSQARVEEPTLSISIVRGRLSGCTLCQLRDHAWLDDLHNQDYRYLAFAGAFDYSTTDR